MKWLLYLYFARYSGVVRLLSTDKLGYHSSTLYIYRGCISTSAIWHLYRCILLYWKFGIDVRLFKLLFTLVSFLVSLISICCVMFTVNASKIVDCGHGHTLLLYSLLFWSTWMYRSRRPPVVSKLLSVTLLIQCNTLQEFCLFLCSNEHSIFLMRRLY